jgi:type IV secretory pathway VirB10-like protein
MTHSTEEQSREFNEPSVPLAGGENGLGADDKQEQVVVLRPIWRVIIASILVLIGSVCIYNLFHTLHTLNHPKGAHTNSTLTTASNLDTHWYQDEQVKPSLEALSSTKQAVSSVQASSTPLNVEQKTLTDESIEAMKASITSNQITVPLNQDQASSPDNEKEALAPGQPDQEQTNSLQSGATLVKKPSPYLLQAGTIIPGVLITGINSSLPGQVTAQVRQDVYDSLQGKYLLIPQGSKLIGSYDSKICFGQKRIFLLWQRIILPTGDSIPLGEMPGSDSQGYAGFHDQVNNHYASLFTSAVLMSILSGGAQMASAQGQADAKDIHQALTQSVGLHLAETGSQLIAKGMEVAPTIQIRPGYLFNITVTKDIIFDQPYGN